MIVLGILTGIMLAATVAGLIVFDVAVTRYSDFSSAESSPLEREYFLITGDTDDNLWNTIYEEMSEYALSNGVYVERAGSGLATDYNKAELMKIAINSGTNGIILEADDSEETRELIGEAVRKGIPVVTVLNDCAQSNRKSFVGISYYTLGMEYGKLVMQAFDGKKESSGEYTFNVVVLLDKDVDTTYQNILYSAIGETISNEISSGRNEYARIELTSVYIDNESMFSAEETVRDMLKQYDRIPDAIVTLNELNTRSVYQCIVDSNAVGKTEIIGYYDSETILHAIERHGIYATITMDIGQLAKYCISALNEYNEYGRVSEYYGVDYTLITADNVGNYLKTAAEETENKK